MTLSHIFTVSPLVSVISSKNCPFFKHYIIFDCAGSLLLVCLVVVSRGYPLVAVPWLLIAVLSLFAELGLWSMQTSRVVQGLRCPWACGISYTGIEPVFPASVGRFFTTGPLEMFPVPFY